MGKEFLKEGGVSPCIASTYLKVWQVLALLPPAKLSNIRIQGWRTWTLVGSASTESSAPSSSFFFSSSSGSSSISSSLASASSRSESSSNVKRRSSRPWKVHRIKTGKSAKLLQVSTLGRGWLQWGRDCVNSQRIFFQGWNPPPPVRWFLKRFHTV